MKQRWASLQLTLVLLYLGVLPLTPDLPLPFAFALLALALLAAVPLTLQFARTLRSRCLAPVPASAARPAPPGSWHLLRPVAPGARGTVRSRAPAGPLAARG